MSSTMVQTETQVRKRTLKSQPQSQTESDEYVYGTEKRDGPLNSAMPREEMVKKEQGLGQSKPKYDQKTILEQHCGFFDRDGDGVIWPTETYKTCREFGWGIPLSLFFMAFLHTVQSWGTVPWSHGLPDPLFRIWVKNVHFNKHGSSTMAFNNEGIFRPAFMDDFFDKFDRDGKGGLTFQEGFYGLRRIRMAWDAFGQVSAYFEWGFTYMLIWPEDGVVKKEDARGVLDGSIFHKQVRKNRRYATPNVNADPSQAI